MKGRESREVHIFHVNHHTHITYVQGTLTKISLERLSKIEGDICWVKIFPVIPSRGHTHTIVTTAANE